LARYLGKLCFTTHVVPEALTFNRYSYLYASFSGPQTKFGVTPPKVIDEYDEGNELTTIINELLDLYSNDGNEDDRAM
jgi:hypothetical protein